MSDQNTNTPQEIAEQKAHFFNAIFTNLLALTIFIGGIILILRANSPDAITVINDLAAQIKDEEMQVNDDLYRKLAQLVGYELYNTTNFLLGGILLCIGATMLFARLFDVNAKASGGLKIGPLELPIQVTGTIALLFFCLFGFAGITGLFGLHRPMLHVQDALETVNTATAEIQEARFDTLSQTITDIALNGEFKVEFALRCKDISAGKDETIRFEWVKSDTNPTEVNGTAVDRATGLSTLGSDFVEISRISTLTLNFNLGGRTVAVVTSGLDDETGNFRVLIEPSLLSVDNMNAHSMTSFCHSILHPPKEQTEPVRSNSQQGPELSAVQREAQRKGSNID